MIKFQKMRPIRRDRRHRREALLNFEASKHLSPHLMRDIGL